MIKPNELRINNWISHNNNYVQVFELPYLIDLDENKEAYLVNSIWIDEYRPIPITPEILEKCGFVSNPYQDRYELGDIYVNYCGIRNICWIENAPHIEYLHQLQNYVYINTNKELTFKP